MIKEIFLTYANNSFRDTGNILKFFEKVREFEELQWRELNRNKSADKFEMPLVCASFLPSNILTVLNEITRLIKMGYVAAREEWYAIHLGKIVPGLPIDWYRVAYDAAYGKDSDPCRAACGHKLPGQENCLVCHQESFIRYLDGIIDAKNLGKADHLKNLVDTR